MIGKNRKVNISLAQEARKHFRDCDTGAGLEDPCAISPGMVHGGRAKYWTRSSQRRGAGDRGGDERVVGMNEVQCEWSRGARPVSGAVVRGET